MRSFLLWLCRFILLRDGTVFDKRGSRSRTILWMLHTWCVSVDWWLPSRSVNCLQVVLGSSDEDDSNFWKMMLISMFFNAFRNAQCCGELTMLPVMLVFQISHAETRSIVYCSSVTRLGPVMSRQVRFSFWFYTIWLRFYLIIPLRNVICLSGYLTGAAVWLHSSELRDRNPWTVNSRYSPSLWNPFHVSSSCIFCIFSSIFQVCRLCWWAHLNYWKAWPMGSTISFWGSQPYERPV